jgi:hypothetical protein
MSDSKIILVVNFLLKDKRLIVEKQTIGRNKNLLVIQSIVLIILKKIKEIQISLNNISELQITLIKNLGTERENKNVATIGSATIETLTDIEKFSKYIEEIVYHQVKALNFKPTIKTVK